MENMYILASVTSVVVPVLVLAILVVLLFVSYKANSKEKAPYVLDDPMCKACSNTFCSHKNNHTDDCEEAEK